MESDVFSLFIAGLLNAMTPSNLLVMIIGLAVGIIGRGHLEYRLGVPPQLAALGLESALVLLRAAPPQAGPIADLIGPKHTEG